MAGAPIESLSECVAWLEDGAKTRDGLLIGTEHECLAFDSAGRKLQYDGAVGIRTLMERLAERFDWQPVYEDGRLVSLLRDAASITLEPAGQFELSGAPVKRVDDMLAELDRHIAELGDVASDLGVRFGHVGLDPLGTVEAAPRMPKARYGIMRARMPRVGGHGLQMMHLTCTVQTNVDFTDGAEAMEMMRLGHLATPAIIALFANSPWRGGRPTGMASTRADIWLDVEAARCLPGAMAFDPAATVADWVDWVADAPMYFRKGVDASGEHVYLEVPWGTTFRDFVHDGVHGVRPTLDDWELHLSTVFPDMRLKRYIEIRGADCVPAPLLPGLPALIKGLFYDVASRRAALQLLQDGDWSVDRAALRAAACKDGLDGRSNEHHVGEQARALLDLARAGLDRLRQEFGEDRAADEGLDRLQAIATGEELPAWQQTAARLQARPSLLSLL